MIDEDVWTAISGRVAQIVAREPPEETIVESVARVLGDALKAGLGVPEKYRQPGTHSYVMYPVYVAPDQSFCIASAVWGVGQSTPIHDHGVWGVVGICEGVEHEERFSFSDTGGAPVFEGASEYRRGEVTICCTTDQDVHRVRCGSDVPCVGIHIYGGNIWNVRRRAYDQETGRVSWFVSSIPD